MTDVGDETILERVTPDRVRAAGERLRKVVRTTPLIECDALNSAVGARVLVKPECLQITGSFKIRGAWNRLSRIPRADRRRGVVAFSSGNHAQGVAEAARRLGIPATIVMPADAPALKLARTRRLGARIVLYDRNAESRERRAREIAEEEGAILVPSFDDPDIICGQGTVGLEIVEEAARRELALAAVLFPIGGGGLAAGSAVAIKERSPATMIWGVEPAGWDDTARSLRLGRIVPASGTSGGMCDALMAHRPGRLTFPILHRYLEGGLVVSDEEVAAAVRFAFTELKLVVEPGGAVALAALLAGRLSLPRGTIVVVLSGGNVDPALAARILCEESGTTS